MQRNRLRCALIIAFIKNDSTALHNYYRVIRTMRFYICILQVVTKCSLYTIKPYLVTRLNLNLRMGREDMITLYPVNSRGVVRLNYNLCPSLWLAPSACSLSLPSYYTITIPSYFLHCLSLFHPPSFLCVIDLSLLFLLL